MLRLICKPRCLLVGGVSKTYAMTGWRIGFGAGPQVLTECDGGCAVAIDVGRLLGRTGCGAGSFRRRTGLLAGTARGLPPAQGSAGESVERQSMVLRCLNLRAASSCSSAAKALLGTLSPGRSAPRTVTPMSSRICWRRASRAWRAARMACRRGFACPSPPRPTASPKLAAASPTPAGNCGAQHESSVGAVRPLDRRFGLNYNFLLNAYQRGTSGTGRADHRAAVPVHHRRQLCWRVSGWRRC
jgi:hypothetical protein